MTTPVHHCPSCEEEIPANAVSCPACSSLISGGVFDFGLWNCISLESHGFWWRGEDHGEYSESVIKDAEKSITRINQTKGRLIRLWLLGLLGSLGFQYFAVGRILSGSIRFLWGAFWWYMIILIGVFTAWDADTPGVLRVFFLVLYVLPIIDIIKICLGRFRDVFRKYVA